MAQNALTVTPPNPTPPTNLSSVGSTLPDPATFDPQIYVNTGTGLDGAGNPYYPRANLAPYYDDGVANTLPVISQNEGGGVNGTTAPAVVGNTKVFATNHAALAVGGTTVAAEGAGTELAVTAAVPNPSPAGQLVMVSTGPVLTPGTLPTPNASHASCLSNATTPTITGSPAPNNVASGVGTVAITLTGTNYTRASVVYIDGVAQNTVYVSATSLTVANAPKKSSAGTRSVTVVNGIGGTPSSASTWTFT